MALRKKGTPEKIKVETDKEKIKKFNEAHKTLNKFITEMNASLFPVCEKSNKKGKK